MKKLHARMRLSDRAVRRSRATRKGSRLRRLDRRYSRWNRLEAIAPLQSHPAASRPVRIIAPPRVMDLEENYEATVQLLKDIRIASMRLAGQFMVDLSLVQSISPAASLLLVAECDRWRLSSKVKRLLAIDVTRWLPSVRRRLKEMGFFEVLKAKCHIVDPPQPGEESFAPFRSGNRSPGGPARLLRKSIEELGSPIADRNALYDGLVEAMNNVNKHAYGGGNSNWHLWWISASVNKAENRMTVMVVDHGAGIAKTLPRSPGWAWFSEHLGALIGDQPSRLKAAFSIDAKNMSQTGQLNRGKGLREDIKGYVSTHHSRGSLHVVTNGARYRYERNDAGEAEDASRLPIEFHGTFIEWVIEGFSHEEHDDNN